MPEHGSVAVTMLPWRVGRSVGRTIYAQLGDKPSKRDPFIGVMDTPDLATHAVAGHNHLLLMMKGAS
jgi:hypothetical protein